MQTTAFYSDITDRSIEKYADCSSIGYLDLNFMPLKIPEEGGFFEKACRPFLYGGSIFKRTRYLIYYPYQETRIWKEKIF